MALNLKAQQDEREEKWRADDTLPDSTYTFILTGRELGTSKPKPGIHNGNPKIVLDWTVATGQWQGASVRDHLSFTFAALWRVNTLLEAIGVPIPEKDFDTAEELREWVFGYLNIGTRVEGVVARETYKDQYGQDRVSAKIQRYQTPPGANETPVPASDVPEPKPEEFEHPKPPAAEKLPF